MPVATISKFVDGLLQSQLLDAEQSDEVMRLQTSAPDSRSLARELIQREWLTAYQANQIFQGRGGRLTIGPYALLERLGEGGMGQVFKARQKMLNRVVALKVIRKECLDNPRVTMRFQREIRAAGQLSHPHIVRAYDADQVNGTYYIAMEYIEGVDLAKLLRDSGPLPVNQACEYIRQVALGLQHAFERGLVHRDIKPANLLVTRAVSSDRRRSSGVIPRPLNLPERRSGSVLPLAAKPSNSVHSRSMPVMHYPWGVVKILDMGLARCTDPFGASVATHLTQIGSVMGTPEFIAPEQARDSHNSDIRADLYSLGCTLYFLLTGQPPFPNGSLTEKLLQHQLDEPPAVDKVRRERLLAWLGASASRDTLAAMAHVPAPVEEVIRKLLAKRPEDRYQTPIELANELHAILALMADGRLPKEEDMGTTVPMACVAPPKKAIAPDDATVVQPLILLSAARPSAMEFAGNLSLLLATIGGLAFVVAASAIAVLMGR